MSALRINFELNVKQFSTLESVCSDANQRSNRRYKSKAFPVCRTLTLMAVKINFNFFLSLPFPCPLGAVFQSFASTPSLTPDDDVFKHLSTTYANNHAKMSRGVSCKNSASTPSFSNGITNGAAWYPLTGGMQDYNYVWFGCYEVTLEISCCKFPPAHELKKYWSDNQLSMIKFLAEAHRGVQGFVHDQNGAPIEKASLKVKGRDVGFMTTKYGEFWRILLPGVYKLEVS